METAEVLHDDLGNAVRLPGDYFSREKRVYVNKIGDAIVLIPCNNPWKSLFDSLDEFTDDFMETRSQPEQQIREDLF